MPRIHLLTVMLALLLAACGSRAQPGQPTQPASGTGPVTAVQDESSPACTALNIQPTPGPEVPSLFAPVSAADHSLGPADAAVTIIEYGDFQ
jgi:hypothetical protein